VLVIRRALCARFGQSVRVNAYPRLVRRIIVRALSLYLLFAIIGRFVEEMGAVSCGCRPDCWCKKPILSTFRWVFPYGHRLYSAEGKAALDSD
jgi:hypothetical protein